MLRITIDVFSGLQNPQWTVAFDDARALLRSIAETPEVIEYSDPAILGLGYRGIKIDLLSDDLYREARVPASFRIVGRTARGNDIVGQVLQSAGYGRALFDLRGLKAESLHDMVRNLDNEVAFKSPRPMTIDPERIRNLLESLTKYLDWLQNGGCNHEEIPFDSSFWNDPAHVGINNCYNFATNRRTDTFAQPGRASGHPAATIDCSNIRTAAISDGAVQPPPCPPDEQAPRYLIALVQAPVFSPSWPHPDYHWYRKCPDGFWAHKPGGTPARSYDNSGHTILDPETCDRGPYTNFCGYFYTQKKMVVS